MSQIVLRLIAYLCHLFFFPVVLLDTTSVIGELGWRTYPINGVRQARWGFCVRRSVQMFTLCNRGFTISEFIISHVTLLWHCSLFFVFDIILSPFFFCHCDTCTCSPFLYLLSERLFMALLRREGGRGELERWSHCVGHHDSCLQPVRDSDKES